MTTTDAPTASDEMESLAAQLRMPYTLTPGWATGIFLAELGRHRLIGSRHGDTISVPAQDFSGTSGEPTEGLVEVAPVGALQGFTTTADGTLGLVLIDGTDIPMIHRLLDFDSETLQIGARVEAVWSDKPVGSMLDLAGFALASSSESFSPRAVPGDLLPPVLQVDYSMTLDYQHAYGPYYGTLFNAVKYDRRLRGVTCTKCARVLLPPRAMCDVCFAPTSQWVDIDAVGTVQASSIVHIEFIGQRMKPPYVYSEIVLDGTSTRLIHMIGDVDAEDAKTAATPGARVRAVWSDRRTGSLTDIDYFKLIP
ncbi:OB-fold nucleic acid binding domain-containing protein [Cryobacterium glaciale]|nr:OB-fold domain-containing protein [Cryobacterium glaciale]